MIDKFNIVVLNEADSTNLRMQSWLKQNRAKHGDVLYAINQYGGIGQEGNSWESKNGENLTFSIYLDPGDFLDAENVFALNKMVSLGIANYLQSKQVKGVSVKWPNDVYVGNKKIAGMLTHNQFLGAHLQGSIIGVGLNVNQSVFYSNAPNPVSLKMLTGKHYMLLDELNLLLEAIKSKMQQFLQSPESVHISYLSQLYGFAQKRKYKDAQGVFTAEITGVDTYGRLLLQKESGETDMYDMKAVTFLQEEA